MKRTIDAWVSGHFARVPTGAWDWMIEWYVAQRWHEEEME